MSKSRKSTKMPSFAKFWSWTGECSMHTGTEIRATSRVGNITITELKEPDCGNGPLVKHVLADPNSQTKKRFVLGKVYPASQIALQIDACGVVSKNIGASDSSRVPDARRRRSQLIKIEPAEDDDKESLRLLRSYLERGLSVSIFDLRGCSTDQMRPRF
jgi:hypothetical protein